VRGARGAKGDGGRRGKCKEGVEERKEVGKSETLMKGRG